MGQQAVRCQLLCALIEEFDWKDAWNSAWENAWNDAGKNAGQFSRIVTRQSAGKLTRQGSIQTEASISGRP